MGSGQRAIVRVSIALRSAAVKTAVTRRAYVVIVGVVRIAVVIARAKAAAVFGV